jgi:DNA (cytosine-5)-methyltransferase 1
MSKTDNSIISLFSGAMGLDLGLELAGFKTGVVVETNKSAVSTIKKNRPKLPVIDEPVQVVPTEKILEKAKLSVGEAMLVSGGPCCQSFSTAGKRGSLCDPRGSLFKDFCRVVREAQPRYFIMENVKGLLSAAIKHRPLNERGPGFPPLSPEEELGTAFKLILKELATLNYYVTFSLVNAADYGTPQIRYRVIIIGSRDGEDISIPEPTHYKESSNGKPKWGTLRDALRGVRSKKWVEFTDKNLKFLRRLDPGENWTSLPKKLQKEALGAAFHSWGGRKGFYRRLSWDKPSPSLTTAPDGKATMLCHPIKDRPLSVEEYARLQEFPAGYVFSGSTRAKYIMIGNAVPLSIGFAIGKMLKTTMNNTHKNGLPKGVGRRKGIVECGDPVLAKRLQQRPKTQLNPPRLRRDPDPKAAKKWLSQVGESIMIEACI